jgi:hypothetical protein
MVVISFFRSGAGRWKSHASAIGIRRKKRCGLMVRGIKLRPAATGLPRSRKRSVSTRLDVRNILSCPNERPSMTGKKTRDASTAYRGASREHDGTVDQQITGSSARENTNHAAALLENESMRNGARIRQVHGGFHIKIVCSGDCPTVA